MTADPKTRNRRAVLLLGAIVLLMVSLAYASVPLYSLFCQKTGFGGTTRRADVAPSASGSRLITVSFNADVNGNLPWDFAPETRSVQVRPGEAMLVTYRAHNKGGVPLVGTAVYNVQPNRAGEFFNKIQCFCFTEQLLQPGETKELPVQFFVDPSLADDPKNLDLKNITLSYTFYLAKDQSKAKTIQAATNHP